jgi:predicted CXXCH cytochrome family protein
MIITVQKIAISILFVIVYFFRTMKRASLMHRYLRGFSLALCLIGVLLISSLIYAQDGDEGEAEYLGSDECLDCHRNLRDHQESRHALTFQEVGGDEALILASFEDGAEVPTLTFPDEEESRSVTADDIAFSIGSGRYVQRYLYEVGPDEYQVMPIEWNVSEQHWQPYTLADEWPSSAYDWSQNCVGCHTTGLNVTENTWLEEGVQCEACHGPGSLHVDLADGLSRNASDEDVDEVRSKIILSDDAQICGQCHSRGMNPDGYAYPTHYVPGMDLLEEGGYSLFPPDDSAHWWLSGHAKQANMQFNEWSESAHASSLTTLQGSSAAEDACLQCHGGEYRRREYLLDLFEADDIDGISPGPLTVESAQFGVTCTTCHNPHSEEELEDHVVQEPYALCVQCHSNSDLIEGGIHHPVREMFEGVALVEGIEGIPSTHFSEEAGPDCLTCHMADVPVGSTTRDSHALSPILPSADGELPSVCLQCHFTLSEEDVDLTEVDWDFLVTDTQENVRTRLSVAWARVASLDVPESGTDARMQYDQVVAALTFAQNDGSLGVHNYAYTDTLLSSAEQSISELNARGSSPQPTEAPAPTATPAEPDSVETIVFEEEAKTGPRPMTWLIMAFIVVVLAGAAFAFFRSSSDTEA